jgi:hypothetical protein
MHFATFAWNAVRSLHWAQSLFRFKGAAYSWVDIWFFDSKSSFFSLIQRVTAEERQSE